MEAKPHFSAPTKRVRAALRRGEKGAAHGGVPGTKAPRDPSYDQAPFQERLPRLPCIHVGQAGRHIQPLFCLFCQMKLWSLHCIHSTLT